MRNVDGMIQVESAFLPRLALQDVRIYILYLPRLALQDVRIYILYLPKLAKCASAANGVSCAKNSIGDNGVNQKIIMWVYLQL